MSNDILASSLAGQELRPGVRVLPGQGNTVAVETSAGAIVLDASSQRHVPGMIAELRSWTDAPVHAIVYSHGHHGYNAAVDAWQAHNAERNDPTLRLVAHENLPLRYARYRMTAGLQARMAAVQFPSKQPIPLDRMGAGLTLHDPTETFGDSMIVVDGERRVDVIWAPSEVDDALALWLPDDGVLCGGAATPGMTIPNIGTPLRTQRLTIRWADTLDRLRSLDADLLVTEFGPLVEGPEVERQLRLTSEALRWLHAEVIDRMNAGMGEEEIVADMTYPSELFDQPWMLPSYGAPDYIVRDIWRQENGWWDRNPTTLHPAAPTDAAAAIRSAIDPSQVLARASELAEAGETQLALHVVDLLAFGPAHDPDAVAARTLKAELCRTRASEVRPFVSKSCYRSTAHLLEKNETSWTALD